MKTLVKNVHIQSILIAVISVGAMVALLFWLQATNPPYQRTILWVLIIGILLVNLYTWITGKSVKT